MKYVHLLAKFNPKTGRFDIGTGGDPVITQDEVADALNAVTDPVGSSLLCLTAWPNTRSWHYPGAIGYAEAELRAEYGRQAKRVAEAEAAARNAAARDMAHYKRKLQAAKNASWPDYIENRATYDLVARAALAEATSDPAICRTCNGNGIIKYQGKITICPTCGGAHVYAKSNRQRAKEIRRNERTFRRAWQQPYEHLWDRLCSRLFEAGEQFGRQIQRNRKAAR